ncbi:MAG: DUF2804 domain-containing protein [Myxococcales bacterium]|nr:DUF2804 domain-containing protein [Myxococcales bacterium]
MPTHEPELLARGRLTTDDGRLHPAARGFSRRPLLDAPLPGPWGRRKRWDYACVIGERGALQLTLADLDYLGLVELAWVDLERRTVVSAGMASPFGLGLSLGDGCGEGDARGRLPFVRGSLVRRDGGVHLSADGRGVQGRIQAEIFVGGADESLDVVVPFDEEGERFQLTSKHVARPAHGEVRVGGETIVIDGFGAFDHGRGVWPTETTWNWATAAGLSRGRRVGVQLGARWTDGTGATENGVFVDGRLDKLGCDVRLDYDLRSVEGPWTVRDRCGHVDLQFWPRVTRRTNLDLGLARTALDLRFGRWTGHVIAFDERIVVDGFLGWAEEHRARW